MRKLSVESVEETGEATVVKETLSNALILKIANHDNYSQSQSPF